MKRAILLLAVFCIAAPAFATSGACSSHGGVNCSVQTTDGYAVCADGVISSVAYSAMKECVASACIAPPAYGCTSQDDYDALNNQISGASYSVRQSSRYAPGNMAIIAEYQQQLDTCQEQIDQYSADVEAYNTCVHTRSCGPVENGEMRWDEDAGCRATCDKGYYAANRKCLPNAAPKQEEPAVEPEPVAAPVQPPPTPITPIGKVMNSMNSLNALVGKPITPKAAPKAESAIEATTTATTSAIIASSAPPSDVVPTVRYSFFHWLNPFNWF